MNKTVITTLRNTILAVIYIFGISQVLNNSEVLFGKMSEDLAPFVFLMLFSFSAAIVGLLVFGQSILLFMEGNKKESIKAAIYSVGWLGLFTTIGLIALFFFK